MIGIYKITSPTNRVYIGQSTNIELRFKSYNGIHCKNQTKLYRSLLKHGVSRHKFEIICECSLDELNDKERYYQEIYNCIKTGLNCSLVGTKDNSGFMSEESKKRMSIAQTGKKLSSNTRSKMSESKKGIPKPKRSIEHCKKMSTTKIGNKNMLGKKHSEESKLKISKSKTGFKMPEYYLKTRRKEIINTITGEIYFGVKSVANILGCKPSGLNHKLNGINNNNTIYKYK